MSDYFGALLRAAGVTTRPAVAAAEDGVQELHVEQEASEPANVAHATPPPRTPRDEGLEATVAQPPAAPVPARPEQPVPPDLAPPAETRPITPRPPSAVAAPLPQEEPPLHPAVQAALRWVAADPTPRRADTASERQPEAAAAAPAAAARTPEPLRGTPALHDAQTEVVEVAPRIVPARPAPPAGTIPARRKQPAADAVPTVVPPRRVADEPSPPLRSAAAQPAEERVEIHIGRIELRIDAPPALQTGAAPRPAAAAPAPARPAARSGFARCRLPRL